MTARPTLLGFWPHGALSEMQLTVILRRRLPDTVLWFGPHTRHWWAMLPARGRWCLVEAADPDELTGAIVRART
ncbi:hypothetical protein [Actinoallomurus rhizosphaericola]|uniref:hypothetical protein n=1 Tax=Actinoallomurus rhizosphaericola TaxID=2952536 RepID=UPI00209165B8|nr:hypothetical protein [Actinoallomurus rhizosphaericola]MCO5992220.1 hypothetical protein [Actinoallomurus rhizosphaericola]